jgi:protocatechuate 3,4-dioxygenase alpha subunit
MKALQTRIYFEGDAGHDVDPVLNLIEDSERRATLVAKKAGATAYHLDVVLQGPGETVFFAI